MSGRGVRCDEDVNGRTHEPSLRELTAELDAVRELMLEKASALRDLVDERDRLYKERDDSRRTAVDAALAAAKEMNVIVAQASEKAIVKAENAQSEYNVRSNEFRGQLDDQAKMLISRTEVETMIRNIEEKIMRNENDVRALREGAREGIGKVAGAQVLWGLLIGLLMAGITVMSFFRH